MCTSFNDRQTGLNPTVHLSLGLFIENERAKKKGGEKSREERERGRFFSDVVGYTSSTISTDSVDRWHQA